MASKSMRERLTKRKEELSKKGNKIPYFIFKEGTHRMRLVPIDSEKEFAVEATFFFLSKEIGGVISPVTFSEPCAIMEAYQKLKNSKSEDDRELAKKIAPKKRFFALHYKYADEKGKKVDMESGVKLAILTNQQYQDLIDLYLDDEAGDMTDPKTGYDIKYKRTGSGQFDTEYTVLRCNPTRIAKEFKGKRYDTEKYLRKIIPTYEETQDFVKQVLGSSVDDGDGVKKKKKKKKGKKNRD